MTLPDLCSLVIPIKNGGPLFADVVAALQKQSCWPRVEFIVIDSGSTDDTVDIARRAGARCSSVPPQDFNHGATRDLAIAQASCERIVLMVQDAVLQNTDALEKLVAALDDPRVAGAYARQVARPEADILTRRNIHTWLAGRPHRDVKTIADPAAYAALPPLEKYMLCAFDNVCSVIRKSVWQHQPFGTVAFGEDIQWAERAMLAGHAIVYEPAAVVMHSHDRPLSYEFKRLYVCHRHLFRQFGLAQVPTLHAAAMAWLRGTARDILYVLRHERRWGVMAALIAEAPIAHFLNALARWRAVGDERRGIARPVQGV